MHSLLTLPVVGNAQIQQLAQLVGRMVALGVDSVQWA